MMVKTMSMRTMKSSGASRMGTPNVLVIAGIAWGCCFGSGGGGGGETIQGERRCGETTTELSSYWSYWGDGGKSQNTNAGQREVHIHRQNIHKNRPSQRLAMSTLNSYTEASHRALHHAST